MNAEVSIPRSEFWSFGPRPGIVEFNRGFRFNSSVGILVVRTCKTAHHRLSIRTVSIPRSEFWSFGHALVPRFTSSQVGFNSSVGILVVRTSLTIRSPGSGVIVSIPRSEFWSFGPYWMSGSSWTKTSFQFLGRNSGRSDVI